MILRPRILLIVIITGLFWLAVLIAPLLALAGWRLEHPGMLWVGIVGLAACAVVYILNRQHGTRLRSWANHGRL